MHVSTLPPGNQDYLCMKSRLVDPASIWNLAPDESFVCNYTDRKVKLCVGYAMRNSMNRSAFQEVMNAFQAAVSLHAGSTMGSFSGN